MYKIYIYKICIYYTIYMTFLIYLIYLINLFYLYITPPSTSTAIHLPYIPQIDFHLSLAGNAVQAGE